jgi:hypothetical protein
VFDDVVDASFMAINVCEHVAGSFLEPVTENFVEVTAKSGVQLVFFRDLNE